MIPALVTAIYLAAFVVSLTRIPSSLLTYIMLGCAATCVGFLAYGSYAMRWVHPLWSSTSSLRLSRTNALVIALVIAMMTAAEYSYTARYNSRLAIVGVLIGMVFAISVLLVGSDMNYWMSGPRSIIRRDLAVSLAMGMICGVALGAYAG